MIPHKLMTNQNGYSRFLYFHEVFTSLHSSQFQTPKHSISQPKLDTNYFRPHSLAPEYIKIWNASERESQGHQTQTFELISHKLMLHQNGYLWNEKGPLQLPVVPTKNHYFNNIIKIQLILIIKRPENSSIPNLNPDPNPINHINNYPSVINPPA